MEKFTPVLPCDSILNEADPDLISANLFKNTPIPPATDEKLQAFLRIRPIKESSIPPFAISGCDLLTDPPKTSKAFKSGAPATKKFTFNHVFDADVTQEAFYERCALPLVTRLILEDSSLLFAYGTTNSGKSYTMRGTNHEPGLIPRAINTIFTCLGDRIEKSPVYRPTRFAEVEHIFESDVDQEQSIRSFIKSSVRNKSHSLCSLKSLSMSLDSTRDVLEETQTYLNSGRRFCVWVSFLEFYMDSIKDLLAADPNKRQPQLILVPDGNNNYYIKNLRRVSVSTAEEAWQTLIYGWDNLHRAKTLLNEDSSRSHCIFTITLVSFDPNAKDPVVSNLSFCDLAGSERGDRTQNTGHRLKEAGNINSSLFALSRCISVLRTNQKRKAKMVVPFRDSPLTKFFQSYFNGTGRASMIININPSCEYFDETLVALQFSAEASELTISNEEAKRRLKESFTRLTQQWIQSNHRWSSFAQNIPKSSMMSTIIAPSDEPTLSPEDDDDYVDEDTIEITQDELDAIESHMLSNDDPELLLKLQTHIDFLTERLKANETEKFALECKIRNEVASELKAITNQMTVDHAEQRKKLRRELESTMSSKMTALQNKYSKEMTEKDKTIQMLEQQIISIQNKHKQELEQRESRISLLEQDVFSVKPEVNNEDVGQNNKRVSLLQEMENLKKEVSRLKEKNVELQNDVNKWMKEVNQKDVLLEDQRKLFESEKEKASQEIQSMMASLQKSSSRSNLLMEEINQMKEREVSLRQSLAEIQSISESRESTAEQSTNTSLVDVPSTAEKDTSTLSIQTFDKSVLTEDHSVSDANTSAIPELMLNGQDADASYHKTIISTEDKKVQTDTPEKAVQKTEEKEDKHNNSSENANRLQEMERKMRELEIILKFKDQALDKSEKQKEELQKQLLDAKNRSNIYLPKLVSAFSSSQSTLSSNVPVTICQGQKSSISTQAESPETESVVVPKPIQKPKRKIQETTASSYLNTVKQEEKEDATGTTREKRAKKRPSSEMVAPVVEKDNKKEKLQRCSTETTDCSTEDDLTTFFKDDEDPQEETRAKRGRGARGTKGGARDTKVTRGRKPKQKMNDVDHHPFDDSFEMTARKRIPITKRVINSISPILQKEDEDTTRDVMMSVVTTGRKLRTRAQKNDVKVAKKRLF